MARSKEYKQNVLKEYENLLEEVDGYIAVDPQGVGTLELTQLKKNLKEKGSKMIVIKNTIFKIALLNKKEKLPLEASDFTGSTAIITYKSDPTVPAKLIKEAREDETKLIARYGFVEGSYITKDQVMNLADIPSKDELLGRFIGTLSGTLSGFLNTLTGNVSNFINIVDQLAKR